MDSSFYKMFSSCSKEELLDVLSKESEYQPEAVEAAKDVAAHNGWLHDIEKSIADKRTKEEKEIEDKAAYYRKAVEFEHDDNKIYIRFSDTVKFESSLEEAGIDFHKEEILKNPRYRTPIPGFYYYFKNKDIDRVDEIVKRLQVIQPGLPDSNMFLKFESKVMLIIAAGVLMLIAYLYFTK